MKLKNNEKPVIVLIDREIETGPNGRFLKFTAWHYREESDDDEKLHIEVRQSETPKPSKKAIPTWKEKKWEGPRWFLAINRDEYKRKWFEKWIKAFCVDHSYRPKFCIYNNGGEYQKPRERINKKTGDISLQSTLPTIPSPPSYIADKLISMQVQHLVNLGDRAKPQDFLNLKAGRDNFSYINLEALNSIIGEGSKEYMRLDIGEQNKARVARWVMRGLPIPLAIHKIKIDGELALNVILSRGYAYQNHKEFSQLQS